MTARRILNLLLDGPSDNLTAEQFLQAKEVFDATPFNEAAARRFLIDLGQSPDASKWVRMLCKREWIEAYGEQDGRCFEPRIVKGLSMPEEAPRKRNYSPRTKISA
jgi:hypothetical protein